MNYKMITSKQSTETSIVFALSFIVLGLLYNSTSWYYASVAFLVAALLFPFIFKPLAYVWFGLAKTLSWFTSRLLLSILFFLLVTPVALIRKLLGKESLQLKAFKKNKPSAFVPKNRKFTVADIKYPF